MNTEHVCEFRMTGIDVDYFRCESCAEALSIEEVEARLDEYETLKKATDKLGVEDARTASKEAEFVGAPVNWEALSAYADILEETDND